MASATGTISGAGSAGDCDGEEQEDPSSSNNSPMESNESASFDSFDFIRNLNLNDVDKDNKDELTVFRQQWQRELVSTTSPQIERAVEPEPKTDEEPLTEEEKAKQLFLCGVEMERSGKLNQAILHYKRAIQILPDVERRLYEESDLRSDTPEKELETVESYHVEHVADSNDKDAVEGEDLIARLQKILAREGKLCEPEFHTKGGHISWLPYELIQLMLRWVVGADIDAAALERAGSVCRGFYVAARDQDVWRCMCVRTWGIECGKPRAHGFRNWRHMYIDRVRLNLHGCYISKTTYLRYGENNYQDQYYRPWYLVDYYRYLRFFPEGLVLMWTTADEPAACVGHLKNREVKSNLGIMSGHYRLVGDRVIIVIKKTRTEKKPSQTSNTRFQARSREAQKPVFHIDLQLISVRQHRNWQLVWHRYDASTRRDQWTTFDISSQKNFPPFFFSPVRSYTAETTAPLFCSNA